MNLALEKIAPFCTTKVQLKRLEQLSKKPFSVKNSKMQEQLTDLMYSLFAEEKYEALAFILPELNTVKFDGNFDIWGNIEPLMCLMAQSPLTTADEREQIFSQIQSVTERKDEKWQELYDTYFARIFSAEQLTQARNDIQESIEDEDVAFEYASRFGAVCTASRILLVAEKVDFKSIDFPAWLPAPSYQNQTEMLSKMHTIISDNLTEIRSGKFKKQI